MSDVLTPRQPLTAAEKSQHHEAAEKIIKKYTMIATGVGLIPIAGVDVLANTGLQYMMIKELTEQYGLPFDEHRANVGLSALGGSVIAGLATYAITEFIGGDEVTSNLTASLSGAAISGTYTTIVGEMYKAHFEVGGTLESLDVAKYIDHFVTEYQNGNISLNSFTNPSRMFSYLT